MLSLDRNATFQLTDWPTRTATPPRLQPDNPMTAPKERPSEPARDETPQETITDHQVDGATRP